MFSLDEITVWILDTSSLVETKSVVTLAEQWETFKLLEDMVNSGKIAMPKQVINELSEFKHPDIPGAWATGIRKNLKFSVDVNYESVATVQSKCPKLTDYTKENEDADPYVVALAHQLKAQDEIPCVVTEDKVNHKFQSIVNACSQLEIKCTDIKTFLTHCKSIYKANLENKLFN